MQALYQWQIGGQEPGEILREFIAERELENVDLEYFSMLTREAPRRFDELKAELEPLLDRAWGKLGPVERSVLLIGCYELKYCLYIPWRVVVNEGIELCKMFGAEEAHKYVNGVLDKLARRLRPAETDAPPATG